MQSEILHFTRRELVKNIKQIKRKCVRREILKQSHLLRDIEYYYF